MSDAPRYRIRTVFDFLSVPEDRLDVCLSEFRTFLRAGASLKEFVGSGVEVRDEFTWIDDGVRNINIRFIAQGQEPAE